jgi:hypothetical protein
VSWYDNEYSFTCQYVRLAANTPKSLALSKEKLTKAPEKSGAFLFFRAIVGMSFDLKEA